MAIERSEVQGLQPVQPTGVTRGSATSTIQVGTPRLDHSKSSFVTDLLSAAGAFAKVGTDIMNQAVEDDKVRQYDRAMQGLLPSDDATRGGTRAHMLVQLQNDVVSQTTYLTDEAKRFQGTDEEWEQLVVDSRNGIQDKLWKQYPELQGDLDTMKMVTNAFMEQQPKIFSARASAKLQREAQERTDAMRSRIIMVTEGLSGKPLDAALHQLQREAITMQLTKPEYEELVAQIAMERASIGDGTLVDGTKSLKDAQGVSLYERNGKLMTAEISANRTWAAQNQVTLFQKKDSAIKAYEAGELSKSEMLQIMENHNRMSGGTAWSDSEIKSLFDKVAKQHAENANLQDLIARGTGASPLGLQDISEKDRKTYAEAIMGVYTKLAEDEIARTGAQGEEAEAIRGRYEQMRYMKLGQQLIKDPNIKARYDSLMQMSSANLADMKVEPEALQTLMRARDSIPEDARRAVMGDEEYAFVENYDFATRIGMNTAQSIEFAQRASRSKNLSGSVIKELSEEVESVVDSVAGGSWLTLGDNMSDVGRDIMLDDAMNVARVMKVAGNNNDTIKRHLESFLKTQYTQMAEGFFKQGVLVRGDIRGLGDTIDTGNNTEDTARALRLYMDKYKQELLDASGGLEEKDLFYDVDMKRGMFVIRGGSAQIPLTQAMPLSYIKGQQLLQEDYNAKVKEREDAKKAFEEQQLSRFGYGAMARGDYLKAKAPTAQEVARMGISNFLVSEDFKEGASLPTNFEFGYKKNNADFINYVAKTENGDNVGLDKVAGVFTPYKDAHGYSVGYGHFITPQEKSNGYIMIGDEKVPFEDGRSELTPERAMRLLEQDLKKHIPTTSDWKVPFEEMHPTVQRGIMDLTYNLGKGGISKSPRALASFKAGNFGDGFIEMLATSSTEGKRSGGLLARRASAYNMAMGKDLPKITEVEVKEDGSMYVKFSRAFGKDDISASNLNRIDKDGWLQVYSAKEGSLHSSTRVGKIKIN